MADVSSSAELEVRSGPLAGRRLPVPPGEALIGRGGAAALRVPDESASREHALLSFDPDSGTWSVEDLHSTNGTRVNGRRVRSSPLRDGDEIQVGSTRLAFRLRDDPTRDGVGAPEADGY